MKEKQCDNRYKFIGIIAFICLLLDQITKNIVLHTIPLHRGIEVIPNFFNITHIQNHGAAFGFLNDSSTEWQFWLFFLATIISLALIYSLTKSAPYNKMLFLSFGFIVGGALGNFVDRVRFKSVTDFLDFYINSWHWPAFNVADITITLGAIGAAILLYNIPEKRSDREEEKEDTLNSSM